MNYTYPQPQYAQPQVQFKPTQSAHIWNQPIPTQLVRPVSSIEEVRASPIDFDGSIFYFPDVNNKRIYTKSINADGTVAINLYELTQLAEPATLNQAYVTRDEFEKVINQLRELYAAKPEAPVQPPVKAPQEFVF